MITQLKKILIVEDELPLLKALVEDYLIKSNFKLEDVVKIIKEKLGIQSS